MFSDFPPGTFKFNAFRGLYDWDSASGFAVLECKSLFFRNIIGRSMNGQECHAVLFIHFWFCSCDEVARSTGTRAQGDCQNVVFVLIGHERDSPVCTGWQIIL